MKTHNRSNALLMELLIVIGVFMLATALLMQLFGKVSSLDRQSRLLTGVLAEAQNQADRLYAAEEPEEELRRMGFEKVNGEWVYAGEGYTSTAVLTPGEDGWTGQKITVCADSGETLLELPCSRWREVSP